MDWEGKEDKGDIKKLTIEAVLVLDFIALISLQDWKLQ